MLLHPLTNRADDKLQTTLNVDDNVDNFKTILMMGGQQNTQISYHFDENNSEIWIPCIALLLLYILYQFLTCYNHCKLL